MKIVIWQIRNLGLTLDLRLHPQGGALISIVLIGWQKLSASALLEGC